MTVGPQPSDWQAGLDLAAEAVSLLTRCSQTVAVAESLTGGLLAAALTSVPGSSAVFRGGVVAYATDLKNALLGVPAALLARYGAVHPEVAAEMAAGARQRLTATLGLATTGVAGPDPQDGQPAGTVYMAVSGPAGTTGQALSLAGDRQAIRFATVRQALALLIAAAREEAGEGAAAHGAE